MWPIIRVYSDIFLEENSQSTNMSQMITLCLLKHEPRASRILPRKIPRHSVETYSYGCCEQENFKIVDLIYVVKTHINYTKIASGTVKIFPF